MVHYLNLGLGVRGCIHWTELAIKEFEVARLAYHRRVVGGISKRRNMHLPTMTTTQINQCITQTTVCTYTTCYGNLIDFEILGSAFEFVDEDVDDRFLQGCTKVGFVLLDEAK